jgi:CBS domain-containing protein
VPTVSPDADARDAIELLAKTDMGAIAVVDEERQVVGIVSESDLSSATRSPTCTCRTTSTSWAGSSSSAR